jgi:hypothetical protein
MSLKQIRESASTGGDRHFDIVDAVHQFLTDRAADDIARLSQALEG